MDFKDRISKDTNRKKLHIISQTPTTLVVDVERADSDIEEEGTPINAQLFRDFQDEIERKIPTKTSQLANDSGFLTTQQDIDSKLEASNIIAGNNISLNKNGNDITISVSGNDNVMALLQKSIVVGLTIDFSVTGGEVESSSTTSKTVAIEIDGTNKSVSGIWYDSSGDSYNWTIIYQFTANNTIKIMNTSDGMNWGATGRFSITKYWTLSEWLAR